MRSCRLALASLLIGCGSGAPSAVSPPPTPTPRASVERPSAYELLPDVLAKHAGRRLDEGRAILMPDGERMVLTPGRSFRLPQEQSKIERAVRLPNGTWAFVGWHRWYTAQTYLGRLTPGPQIQSHVDRVDVGLDGLMVHDSLGRVRVDLTSLRPVPPSVVGTRALAIDERGRGYRLLETGALMQRTPPSETWVELRDDASSLVRRGDHIEVTTAGGRWHLDGGRLVAAPPEESAKRSWLREAFADGVVVKPGEAIIGEDRGVLRWVDLHTGRQRGELKLPTLARCSLYAAPRGVVLAVCAQHAPALTQVFRVAATPVEELRLEGRVAATFYDRRRQQVALRGGCTGDAKDGRLLCVHTPDGRWVERQLTTDNRSLRHLVVLPRHEGPIPFVAFVDGPGQASRLLYRDGDGTTFELQDATHDARPRNDRMWLRKDGAVVYVTAGAVVALKGATATVRRAPGAIIAGGDHWLASGDSTLFQSDDLGLTWAEVEAPPTEVHASRIRCTPQGCLMGPYYLRRGWPRRLPRTRRRPREVNVLPSDPFARAALPMVTCRETGPGTGTRRPYPDDGAPGYSLGARDVTEPYPQAKLPLAQRARGGTGAGPGAVVAHFITDDARTRQTTIIDYILPFDQRAEVRHYAWEETWTSATPPGSDDPTSMVDEGLSWDVELELVPVLGAEPSLLVQPRTMVATAHSRIHWLRSGGGRTLTVNEGAFTLLSAVSHGDELLTLDAQHRLLKIDRAGAVRVLPPIAAAPTGGRRDSLVRTPSGELAVVRYGPGLSTVEDPALLLRTGEPPLALAPWSTLTPADDPRCKGTDGVRAALRLDSLGLWPMSEVAIASLFTSTHAVVTWGTGRVCLQRFETIYGGGGGGDSSRHDVATFSGNRPAARYEAAPGVSRQHPLRCELGWGYEK